MVTTRAKKTPTDIKAELEATRKKVAVLEEKLYATELDELIKKQNIVSSFNVIKANLKEVNDLTILSAIARAVGIKRLILSQAPVKPRAKKVPKDATK